MPPSPSYTTFRHTTGAVEALPDFLAKGDAIDPRQHDIEQNRVKTLCRDQFQGVFGTMDDGNGKLTALLQIEVYNIAQLGVVFNDKDRIHTATAFLQAPTPSHPDYTTHDRPSHNRGGSPLLHDLRN